MKTIARISGVIVGSEFDDPWFDNEIKNGVMTPASSFCYAVASATDELEVRINSFGGDVFAGNSMIIALRQWAAAHDASKMTVIIEAIALSAAANIVAKAPRGARVIAYPDSLIMFHSCITATWGGPGAMKDTAALLEKLNTSVFDAILAKTTLEKSVVTEWFLDERMGWLTAGEALDCHLIDDILAVEATPEPPAAFDDADAPAPRIAAFYQQATRSLNQFHIQQKETTMNLNHPKQEDEDLEKKQDESSTEGEPEKKEGETATDGEGTEGEPEKKEGETATDGEGTEGELEKKEDENEVEQLKKELAAVKAQLDEANSKLAKLTAGFSASPKCSAAPTADYGEFMRSLPTDLSVTEMSRRISAFKAAHPQAYKDYMNSHTKTTVR